MKKILYLGIVLILYVSFAFAQTAVAPSAGDGSETNPYQIASLENLYWIAQNSSSWNWNSHFIQTCDIDASETSTWTDGWKPIGNNETEMFRGRYDGRGNVIDNLSIKRSSESYIGLFGKIYNARIVNLGVTNVNIEGGDNVGGLVGYCYISDIINSYCTGTIKGSCNVGGLIGECHDSNISYCCCSGNVYGDNNVGGFVGVHYSATYGDDDIIEKCYSKASVYGTGNTTGGFVGQNSRNYIKLSYCTGAVNGNIRVGGFVGYSQLYNQRYISTQYCFSTGKVNGNTGCGGFAGMSEADANEICFWDINTSGQAQSAVGIGKTTEELKDKSTYPYYFWYFNELWYLPKAQINGYPILKKTIPCSPIVSITSVDSIMAHSVRVNIKNKIIENTDSIDYEVYYCTGTDFLDNNIMVEKFTCANSEKNSIVINNLSKNTLYTLKVKIHDEIGYASSQEVLIPTLHCDAVKPVGVGNAATPYEISSFENLYWLANENNNKDKHYIQTCDINLSEVKHWDGEAGWIPIGNSNTPFSGNYNGQEYIIDSLIINDRGEYSGLFGYTHGANISNVIISNAQIINNKSHTGILIGREYGSSRITNCHTSGSVNSRSQTGGFIGRASGARIVNCSSKSDIVGTDDIGGFIGIINKSDLINCSSDGVVKGNHTVGGLTGVNWRSNLYNCSSHGFVEGGECVGGLVGRGFGNSRTLTYNCSSYSTSSVNGSKYVGGFQGLSAGIFYINCYSTGSVKGNEKCGGMFGEAYNKDPKLGCFWDIQASGKSYSSGGIGINTLDMKKDSIYVSSGYDFESTWEIDSTKNHGYPSHKDDIYYIPILILEHYQDLRATTASIHGRLINIGSSDLKHFGVCWDTTSNPLIENNHIDIGQPETIGKYTVEITGLEPLRQYNFRLYAIDSMGVHYGNIIKKITCDQYIPAGEGTEENPYKIGSLENLIWMSENPNKWYYHYEQVLDINASGSRSLNDGKGFSPIGIKGREFRGSYDGDGHIIDSLFIFREDESNIGLFGYAYNADIRQLGLTNAEINGGNCTGGIIGKCVNTNLIASYVHGDITGNDTTGSLAGIVKNSSYLNQNYTNGEVEGTKYVGGYIAIAENSSIYTSYAAVAVTGIDSMGGFCALNISSNISSSLWDSDSAGVTESQGGIRKKNEQMKVENTYKSFGWPFNNIWFMVEGENEGYPLLYWEVLWTEIDNLDDPNNYLLYQNYPNPFNPSTMITYDIREDSYAKLNIYNVNGQLVKTLADGHHQAGAYKVKWNASNLSSGIYIYRLEYGEKHISRKMLLIK